MKKITLIAVFITALSVTSFGQAGFGIQAGASLTGSRVEVETNNSTDKIKTDSRFGFVAGLVAAIPLGPVSFRPEINFIQKGYKYDNSQTVLGFTTTTESKARFNYVEVPLNFTYDIAAGGGKFFLGLGPVVGFGINGNFKDKTTVTGLPEQSSSTKIKFDGDDDANDDYSHLKRIDFGGDVLVGYQMSNGLLFNVGYTLGLSDIAVTNNTSLKNSGLALKVGYLFGCNKSKDKSSSKTSTGGM
ncbi:MAG: porin family protein [Ferruginibacter sp.]